MSLRPIVMKFGGTSVEDAAAFERVGRIVLAHKDQRPVVVVSAMSRMTDALLASVRVAAADNARAALQPLDEHFERHARVARAWLTARAAAAAEFEIERTRQRVAALLDCVAAQLEARPLLQDLIVSYGEHLAAMLLTATLQRQRLSARYSDARRCIVTDDKHGMATPVPAQTRRNINLELQPLVAAGEIPVLGGFIAASAAGATTTLGRGGSDYTATLIGAALAAREVQLWTDVPGVLTADPQLVSAACTIPQLSYAEAAALASFGVKVLHAKTVQPLIRPRIPLRICNSHAPEQAGTLICAERNTSAPIIKTIMHKSGAFKLTVNAAHRFRRNGTQRALADMLARYCPTVTAVSVSAREMSVLLDDANVVTALHDELARLGPVVVEQQQAFVGLVGEGLCARTDMATHVCQLLQGLTVAPVVRRAHSVNLMFAVAGDCVARVVRRLHYKFFEG